MKPVPNKNAALHFDLQLSSFEQELDICRSIYNYSEIVFLVAPWAKAKEIDTWI